MSNRVIKFRAWHTLNKVMFAHKDIPILLKNIESDVVWKFMQFTGLHDKNGKEIYEGDIVHAIANHHGEETLIRFNAKIIYNDNIGAFQISYLNVNNHFVNDAIWLKYFLKVIGNIYQDPELLTK